jgi:intein-encoded DNA endonuclease-like protein
MKLTRLNEEKIIELYNDGYSTIELGKKFNCHHNTISNKLKKNNTTLRKYSNRNNRKVDVDINFFKSIDSNDKAYLLGLLISDGSIDNNGYGFQFISKDTELIEDFRKILKSEHKICKIDSYDKRTDKTYTRYTLHICSKDMVDDLKILGIENNKSFCCPMPDIENKYFWHFIRGLFDGDGSVIDYGDGRVRVKFIFSSPIMEHIKKKFIDLGLADNKIQTISKDKNGFEVQSIKFNSYKDVKYIKDNMYENAKYKLKRKYDINDNLIKTYNNIKECSEDLSIKDKYIYRVLRGDRNQTKGYKFKYDN